MADGRAGILKEVEGHLVAYKKAWDNMRSYGGAAETTIQQLEEIEEVEYELASYEEGWVEHAEASEKLGELRKTLKTLPHHEKISALFARQEREYQAVHTIEREFAYRERQRDACA
ncbi:RHTO0S18e02872g1_1 [Rhodotorula toruloides]|uniref:RHTO0S18e02872g1_1 n=1 Tax=Rhodotorula toruloides TaxID=5286 RepID=A0A061BF09_RHOTO|nr:RHTO0S18e02872g1_1 [Rhodotorula toruloides]